MNPVTAEDLARRIRLNQVTWAFDCAAELRGEDGAIGDQMKVLEGDSNRFV